MMPAWLLGPRRIWWFLSDWTTVIRFNFKCNYCGDQLVMEGRGFRPLRWYDHPNPLCRYGPVLRHRVFSPLCGPCWRIRIMEYTFWIRSRWVFRLKYTWGVGVPAECLAGDHDWHEESRYESDGVEYVTGRCGRCGYGHRWERPAI